MMDIPKAIEFIRKAIDEEIPHLKKLHYKDKEFKLWLSKIYDILSTAFGENSREYQGFLLSEPFSVRRYGSEEDFQNDYVHDVEEREQALKK